MAVLYAPHFLFFSRKIATVTDHHDERINSDLIADLVRPL